MNMPENVHVYITVEDHNHHRWIVGHIPQCKTPICGDYVLASGSTVTALRDRIAELEGLLTEVAEGNWTSWEIMALRCRAALAENGKRLFIVARISLIRG